MFEFISDNPIIVLVFTSLIGSKILKNLAYSMCGIFYNKGDAPMKESNLKLAQQDIDEVLKTVEELEVQIDDLSKDDIDSIMSSWL